MLPGVHLRAPLRRHARVRPPPLQAPLLRRQLPPVRGGVRQEAALRQPQVPCALPQRTVQVRFASPPASLATYNDFVCFQLYFLSFR